MSKLRELEVVNFQSWLYGHLVFHDGVNIIRGTSNYGKSALIRAILWALENEPRGADYCNWTKTVKEGVETHLLFDEGFVSRIKSSKFNGYKIENNEFEALYTDVPDEVRQITQMNRDNIHGQDDGYFLLFDSPGQIARKLNSKAGLEDIEKVQSITKGMIDTYTSQLKHTEEDIKEKKANIGHLKKYQGFKKDIEWIDDSYKGRDQLDKDWNALRSTVERIKSLNELIDKAQKVLSISEELEIVNTYLDRRLQISAKQTKLNFVIKNIKECDIIIKELKSELEKESDINDINMLLIHRMELVDKFIRIGILRKTIESHSNAIFSYEDEIEHIERELGELNAQIDMLDACPFCGALRHDWRKEF